MIYIQLGCGNSILNRFAQSGKKDRIIHTSILFLFLWCGNIMREMHGEGRGKNTTPEYNSWKGMKARCYNKNTRDYKFYNSQGITICDRWLNSYVNFLKDIGRRPTLLHTLDRIDNSKGYSPENCRWATRKEQANNTRKTRLVEFNGQVFSIIEWCRQLNYSRRSFYFHLMKGRSPESIIEHILTRKHKYFKQRIAHKTCAEKRRRNDNL